MRAIVVESLGGPEVLKLAEVPKPTPVPTEVLIRVQAAGVNPVDAIARSGVFPLLTPPAIPGWDVAGVVEAVASGVNRFRVGDEVFGMPFFPRPAGAYAEYVAAPARQLARKPRGLDPVQAGGLPLAGLTAWQALVDIADVKPGQRVLIHAAGGGVGHLAVQIAKARGAYVIGTASRGKHELVRSLGADEVLDYRERDFTAAVKNVDVGFDLPGGDVGARTLGVLRRGGLLVSVDHRHAALAAGAQAAGKRIAVMAVEPDHVGLEALAKMADQGQLRVHVGAALPLEDAARAHELLERGGTTGKIVLTTWARC